MQNSLGPKIKHLIFFLIIFYFYTYINENEDNYRYISKISPAINDINFYMK